jgi:hypothetical protein
MTNYRPAVKAHCTSTKTDNTETKTNEMGSADRRYSMPFHDLRRKMRLIDPSIKGFSQMPHRPQVSKLSNIFRPLAGPVLVALLMTSALALTACGGHYRVVDSASGRIFYTRDVDHSCAGTAHFTDARTCEEVNLTSAQVEGITPAEFDRRTARP